MVRSRSFALLVAVAALALPASSLAQSAGDDQYSDPLAGQPSSGGSDNSSGSSGSTPSTPSTPTPAASTSPASTTTPSASAAQSSDGQLPRTGFDVVLTIELGLAMLITGVVAQRMIVLRERRDQR
jgi:hypothetical protein